MFTLVELTIISDTIFDIPTKIGFIGYLKYLFINVFLVNL